MDEKMEYREQLQYLNVLRIVATGFVILLHCISIFIGDTRYFNSKIWWVCNILNSFARTGVPLFFMISGYLLLNNPKTLNIAAFYRKRFTRILIPFLAWDLIYFVYYRLGDDKQITEFIKELFVKGSSYHLWFVYSLIGLYLFLPFLKRIVDNCSLKHLLWFLAIITFTSTTRPFFNVITPFYLFLFDPPMEGYFGYIILGYILGKYDISGRIALLIYLGGIAGALLGIIGNRLFSSPDQIVLYFNGGYQINHFLLASALFVFAKQRKLMKSTWINNFITSVSSITYAVYLSHILVLDILQNYMFISDALLCIFVYFLITTLICLLTMLIIKKIKYINHIFM